MPELPLPLAAPSLRDRVVSWQRQRGESRAGPIAVAVVALVVAAVSVGATYVLTAGVAGRGGGDVALSLPRADAVGGSDAAGAGGASTTKPVGELHVHAAGAVANPGVVAVRPGSRVTDVVSAAGGATADADLDQVNLAAPVADGERVYIPRKGEATPPPVGAAGGVAAKSGAGATGAGIVNINTADQATLETLPGVGPSTAQAIIEYRTQHGRFKSVDELLNVRGIGPSKLSQIKPHARV